MAGRLKVKFLTAIWGARYIKEFARASLPSYLAAGNLPYLASEADLEIVVLTSRASIPQFDAEPIFAKVKALCPLRYIFIDDLITTGNYGVTLTLAYARGIMDSGAEQTNTHFVFMNSDFVLADGSFRSLHAKLRAGHSCIMAPSLRASAETILPTLIEAVDQTSQTLSMAPRRMVQLAFDNLHPTVIGKTATQNFITCTTHNQIYWQADSTTLLARHYLIFMLAIKPERPLGPINSYCDYGFVPELTPSAHAIILDDSDDFFMLELQPSAQESEFLYCGTSSPAEIAQGLARWTTREHRHFAEVDVVFHSRDLPSGLDRCRQEAAAYVSALSKLMPNSPIDHIDHHYWKLGVQSWALLKFAGAPDPALFPPEINIAKLATVATPLQTSKPLRRWAQGKLTDGYLALVNHMRIAAGIIPNVPLWHHLWTDSKLILDWADAVKRQPRSRNLLISKTTSPLATTLPQLVQFETCIDPDTFATRVKNLRTVQCGNDEKRYDNVFFHFRRGDLHTSQKIIDLTEHCIKAGGTLTLHIWHENAELDQSNLSQELAQYVALILPKKWLGYHVRARFAGGLMKRRLRRAERILFRHLIPTNLKRLPHFMAALGLWPAIAILTAANNLRSQTVLANCPAFCTSALLHLTRMQEPAPERVSEQSEGRAP